MGRLEKAGIVVVGGLILVIVVVGALNRQGTMDEDKGPGPSVRADAAKKDARDRLNRSENPVALDDIEARMKKEAAKRRAALDAKKGSKQEKPSDAGGKPVDFDGKSHLANNPSTPSKADPVPPSPAPRGAWPKTYKVKGGDYLEKLCKDFYGRAGMVSKVLAANPGLDPRRMRIDQEIVFPAPPATASRATSGERLVSIKGVKSPRPSFISSDYVRRHAGASTTSAAPSKGRTHKVAKGEVLGSIAKRYYGSAAPKYIRVLVEANKSLLTNPDKLKVGWTLIIPDVN